MTAPVFAAHSFSDRSVPCVREFHWNSAALDSSTLVAVTSFDCPASPEKRRPSASSRTHSDGPVSQTLLTSTSKARAATRLRNPR